MGEGTVSYICPYCNNSGMIRDENNVPVLCECVKRKRLISLYKEIGLPLKFINVNLEQYNIKQDAYGKDIDFKSEQKKITAKNVISNFIDAIPSMLQGIPFVFEKDGHSFSSFTIVLGGKKDSGKSMLSACIVKGALKQGIRPFYLEWSEVINACFDYYSDVKINNNIKVNKYENIMYIIENSDVLIIDNLDSSYENIDKFSDNNDKLTPNVRRQIDSMFSARSKTAAPTVIATNQNFKELTSDNKYGPVLLSVLNDAIKIELPTLGKSNNEIDIKKIN